MTSMRRRESNFGRGRAEKVAKNLGKMEKGMVQLLTNMDTSGC
jgi:hypothetical protein